MAIRIVQSKQNARVKELRAALLRPARGDHGLVALEGSHLVAEALASGIKLATIFIAQGSENLLKTMLLPASIEILALPPDLLANSVSTETPQPIAALAHTPQWNLNQLPEPISTPSLIVVLAAIQDPGNLGTILRSAEAFGAQAVLCLPGTVSCWNPKAMRASAGSVFRLPVLNLSENEAFEYLKETKIQTLATMPHNATPCTQFDLAKPIALFIGSEGSGLSESIAGRCQARITIPCPGPVESLNAAVAASVLLYEAARQRALPAAVKRKPQA